ncbi:MAG TPA: 50S ribosomal protein L7ae [Desulfobacteraceae bacterium]|nr:50S ribosomal protein L7ae [Desulfobacteraceae bacterium]
MPLNELAVSSRLVGAKRLCRALKRGRVKKVFLAKDADPSLTAPLEREAMAEGIPVEWVESSEMLGRACCIERPASAAGIGTENEERESQE